jgi:hypothetical protein
MSLKYQLKWLDYCVTLSVLQQSTAEAVAQFTALELSTAPTDDKVDIAVSERPGYYEVRYLDMLIRCETDDDLLVNLATLAPAHFFSISSGKPALHAGALLHQGEAILFSGEPYCGKSTLAFNAWQSGEEVIGDDWLLYDTGNFTVQGLPKPIKPRVDPKRPPEVSKAIKPQQSVVGKLHREWRLMISRQAGFINNYETPYHIRSLFFISRDSSQCSGVKTIDREQALKQILSQTLLTKGRMALAGIKLLEHLWKCKKVYRLHIGDHDFERAVKLMKSTS